jgi:glycosyltransferase involved in cell wall biosynthesis
MVTDFYAPYVGGVEQHTRVLAHALCERGHDVAVATMAAGDLAVGPDCDGPVRVYRLRTTAQAVGGLFHDHSRPWAPPFPDPRAARALRHIVATERPDVIHGHDWLARSAVPAAFGRAGAPIVTTLHYYTRACAKKTLLRDGRPCPGPSLTACVPCAAKHYGALKGEVTLAANWVGARIERRSSRRTIAVSHATAAGNGPGGAGAVVIPNPVPAPSAVAVRLPPEVDADFLLFAGGTRPEKGADVLRAAYARLDDPPPLLVVGPSTAAGREPLRGVTELGEVPHDVLMAMWSRATVGVFPSVWAEPFGIAIVEAMAAGCPVVAARSGGIPEIVEHGHTGLLVPPGDAAALATAISDLLANPARRRALVAAGRAAVARYAPDVVAAQVEAVYLDAIRATGRPTPPPPAGRSGTSEVADDSGDPVETSLHP